MAHVNDFIVDLKAVRYGYPGNKPYVVGWGDGYGFGAKTEELALAEAERNLGWMLREETVIDRFRAGVCVEIARVCPLCRCTGTKPGCKRKKCPECSGAGTVDRFGFVILKPGVDPDGNKVGTGGLE